MEHECDEFLMARVGRDQPELLEKLLRRQASPLLTFLQRVTRRWRSGLVSNRGVTPRAPRTELPTPAAART